MFFGLCGQISVSLASTVDERQTFKKEFFDRITKGFKKADKFLETEGYKDSKIDLRGLPEGESLIFNLTVPPRLLVEGAVFGEIYKNDVILSLKDLINVLQFPIDYDDEKKIFSGWFAKEDMKFTLDMKTGKVFANGFEYSVGDTSKIMDDDVMASSQSLQQWFYTKMDVDVGAQRIALKPEQDLPATLRFERRNKNYRTSKAAKPELPRHYDDYAMISMPVADINTMTRIKKDAQQKSEISRSANIRTAGEFAKGALITNLSLNDKDHLASARLNYLQESADPEIMGSLNARRFEAGDILPTRLPLTGGSSPETGVRITNADPLSNLTLPSTQIAGYFLPDWDVELYRDTSLLGFQQANGEGYYSFENIPLFSDRNVFRIVGYGPQGETKEETINVPYDRSRLAKGQGVYDVSLSLQERQTYQKTPSKDIDRDTPNLTGFYEFPINETTAVRIGGRARQEEGKQKAYSNAALSTTYEQTLINSDIAADEKGEYGTSLTAAREFGSHRARMELTHASQNYNPGQEHLVTETFSNSVGFDGPIPLKIGTNPTYSTNLKYSENSDDSKNLGGFLSLNTQFDRIGYNQVFNYNNSNSPLVGTQVTGASIITGSYGANIFRALANYDLEPKQTLESLTAFWKRRFNRDVETQLQISHDLKDQLTRYSARVNWRNKNANIIPSLTYDSTGNVEATLATRFSLAKVPRSGKILMTEQQLTNSGSLSAFVYLDRNGDKKFSEGDEPIEGVSVRTPQNAGRGETNKDGIAYISQLRPNILTDVYVENASLPDPYWIKATKGVSVMPRTGDNIPLEFPVQISGEIEGIVNKQSFAGSTTPLSKMIIALYDMNGDVISKTETGPDGYYIISLIPPGTYFLILDNKNIPKGFGRPRPKKITIGFDGTILYEQDIVLKQGHPDVGVLLKRPESAGNSENKNVANIVLNFGSFNSRLMMAYVWKKLTMIDGYFLGGSKLLSAPKEASADKDTGKYTLRVKLSENSFSSGYKRCQEIVKRGNFCSIEVSADAL